jgi:hypothetical protein
MKPFAQFISSFSLVLALMGSASPNPSLENLPTGEYYYQKLATENASSQSVWFRKAGRTVIGVVHAESGNLCFRGFAEGNQIVNATRVFPPYDPASRQDFQEEMLDLSQYSPVEEAGRDRDRTTLRTCIQFFWR